MNDSAVWVLEEALVPGEMITMGGGSFPGLAMLRPTSWNDSGPETLLVFDEVD